MKCAYIQTDASLCVDVHIYIYIRYDCSPVVHDYSMRYLRHFIFKKKKHMTCCILFVDLL